jgi:antitoxin (DNA-binding transcriptional repressor) of toxin-antitoxin stability system
MISVGIRELKTHLSQYIELVKTGQNILITDHNKIVAELKIPDSNNQNNDDLSKILEDLTESGKLIKPKRKPNKITIEKKYSKSNNESYWNFYQSSKSDYLS